MTELNWDPLFDKDYVDEGILAAAKKKPIKNILKSYVSVQNPFKLTYLFRSKLTYLFGGEKLHKNCFQSFFLAA